MIGADQGWPEDCDFLGKWSILKNDCFPSLLDMVSTEEKSRHRLITSTDIMQPYYTFVAGRRHT